jgi:hypothetical protein
MRHVGAEGFSIEPRVRADVRRVRSADTVSERLTVRDREERVGEGVRA